MTNAEFLAEVEAGEKLKRMGYELIKCGCDWGYIRHTGEFSVSCKVCGGRGFVWALKPKEENG